MESQNNNAVPEIQIEKSFAKSSNRIVILLSILFLGCLLGYFFGVWVSSRQVDESAMLSTQIPLITQSNNQLEKISFLMKHRSRPGNEKTIFITKDDSEESLKISDIDMNAATMKTLYSFDFPSPVGFSLPLYSVNDYIVAPVSGADANDIMIFSLQGDRISTGVRQDNIELSNWLVYYDEWVKENIVKVKLFKIDNSTGTAQIDLTTGKIVPDSYAELGTFQE